MKIRHYLAAAAVMTAMATVTSCDDDMSTIGGSLSQGEVTIMADSIITNIDSRCTFLDSIDGRNITKLLGRINVPEYGSLTCSFVSQMMCATSMAVPDSIKVDDVDSIRLVLSVPRGSLTGDSLAPQQLKVFALEKQLPGDISSTFNPAGYYDPSAPLGTKSYTVSNIAKGDSALKREPYVRIPITMPLSLGKKIFTQYREDPSVFQWPSTFNQYFPGIYVEQNFGNGCIANIQKAEMFTYWAREEYRSVMQEDSTYTYEPVTVRDSVCLMAYQPEVIASNVIDYKVSDYLKNLVNEGSQIITTPGGYRCTINFPVQMLIDKYRENGSSLAVVSALRFEIPAETVSNSYGLTVAPNMLMIKKSEYESFFAENKIPDGKTSFYAAYDSDTGSYHFNAMRSYFMDMLADSDSGKVFEDEDTEFILVPVSVATESVSSYDGSVTTYVTRCQQYIERPSMTRLHTERAIIMFIYSNQSLD